jgi:hypothetical protein
VANEAVREWTERNSKGTRWVADEYMDYEDTDQLVAILRRRMDELADAVYPIRTQLPDSV